MTKVHPRNMVFHRMAEISRALGNPHRLVLLQLVSQGERSVERLAELTGLSIANTSQHLQSLKRNALVVGRRKGKHVHYRLASDQILTVLQSLSVLAEQSSATLREVLSDYFRNLDALEPVSRDELQMRLQDGAVTVLDARPEDEYALGHLPGALSVPDETIEAILEKLPRDQEIVAYCRGTYCVSSFRLVAKLRAMGYNIRRLEEGFAEWQAAGFDVERHATS
ncbi:ArsR/SmtB family transcription factor [Thioclava kandeliae]|uniref:Metalloregulator ArsR/SmtB family transcription factor n=1 Tax=Thioclava kandeliae TaxID=3070818 RepID=A0ABV1SHK0_9RHOB